MDPLGNFVIDDIYKLAFQSYVLITLTGYPTIWGEYIKNELKKQGISHVSGLENFNVLYRIYLLVMFLDEHKKEIDLKIDFNPNYDNINSILEYFINAVESIFSILETSALDDEENTELELYVNMLELVYMIARGLSEAGNAERYVYSALLEAKINESIINEFVEKSKLDVNIMPEIKKN